MKKITLVLAGIAILFLSSCTSFPTPSDETPSILIIDRELDRSSGDLSLYVDYFLVFDNGIEHKIHLIPSDNDLIVDYLPQGNYSVTKMITVHKHTRASDTYTLDSRIKVSLVEGEITVFPYTFIVSMEKTGSRSYMQAWNMKVLSEKMKTALLQEIKEANPEEAALWEPIKSGKY